LFLSSEFNPSSGRHLSDSRLSIGVKNKLQPSGKNQKVKVIDSEIFNEKHHNVAMSKAEFASNVCSRTGPFATFRLENFASIFAIIEAIIDQSREEVDLPFGGFDSYKKKVETLDKAQQLGAILEATLRTCKLTLTLFAAATIRYYDSKTVVEDGVDEKRLRPVRRVLAQSFTSPSLTTLVKLARNCYHIVDDHAPDVLQKLCAVMAENPTLGPLGDMMDDLERLLPPDLRRARTASKRLFKKPLLEYVFAELARYDGRTADVASALKPDTVQRPEPATWSAALSMLVTLLAPLKLLPFRVRTIDRVENDSDQFIVLLSTYRAGRFVSEEIFQEYGDLLVDRLETYELLLDSCEGRESLDLSPFMSIKRSRLHYYSRTRAMGYEYHSVFDNTGHIEPTKRKFSSAALGTTIATDRQKFFWTQVAPSTSSVGVKANIPAHDPTSFVGRKQQIADILQDIIQIPNQNGLVYGPGGVGKTALLIELSRYLFEDGSPLLFENIIWASAKRDYYDPTLGVIENSQQQFKSLDNILTSILEFHEFGNPEDYEYEDKKWLVLEFIREKKTLLILDNFETVPPGDQKEIVRFFGLEVKRALRDKPDQFKVLLTSRELIAGGFHQFLLRGLDKKDSKILMERLDEPYRQSGQQALTEEQRDAMYEASKGIPLIIKHCYGQIYEYNRPVDFVLRNLVMAGNTVVDFSFSEILQLITQDSLQLRIVLLLELIGRPLLVRQISDVLGVDELQVNPRITTLTNFQCLTGSSAGNYEKYGVNDDLRFVSRRLVRDHSSIASEIKKQIAQLAVEKRLDYTGEEFEALVILQEYLAQGQYIQAEDFFKARLHEHPRSVLLNLHYAKYLKEVQRRTSEAIEKLEEIRIRSGNDSQVLRLLMTYHTELEVPNFEKAHSYARELEDMAADDKEITFELANFYTQWSTALKVKIELDPLKNILRQQKYKELADIAIQLLTTVAARNSHECYHLLAQNSFNKWDYDAALRYIGQAIEALPRGSYLIGPYQRLKVQILKKKAYYAKYR
jgi:hypothetical protein